jgi:hypothetical protein
LARMPKQSHFHKRSAGTAGKKPPVPSFKPDAFRTLVEILKRRKPRRADDAESGGRGEAVEAQAPFAKRYEEVRRGEVMGWSPRWGNLFKNVVSRQRRIARWNYSRATRRAPPRRCCSSMGSPDLMQSQTAESRGSDGRRFHGQSMKEIESRRAAIKRPASARFNEPGKGLTMISDCRPEIWVAVLC